MTPLSNIKKKNIKLCIVWTFFLFFLFCFTPIYSCNINKITSAHSTLMTKLNVPKNSLLIIEQNKLSVISDKIVKIKKKSNGLKNINLYKYRSGRLILKEIAQIDSCTQNTTRRQRCARRGERHSTRGSITVRVLW